MIDYDAAEIADVYNAEICLLDAELDRLDDLTEPDPEARPLHAALAAPGIPKRRRYDARQTTPTHA